MGLFNVRVSTPDPVQPFVSGDTQHSLLRYINFLKALTAGTRFSSSTSTVTVDASAVAASGTVTISSGSGTITATINGVGVAITWATSDTVSAALLAAAINASGNALVNQHVTATSALGVTTITANAPGPSGNAVTLAASGTGASASGTRLSSGASTLITTTW